MAEANYLVWSNEHRSWWGPNNAGYYSSIASAGRYTRDAALKICRGARGGRQFNDNPTEIPILLADAEEFWRDETEADRRTKGKIRQQEQEAEDAFYS